MGLGRRRAREQAFLLVFEYNFSGGTMEDVIETAEDCREEKLDDFSKATAMAVTERIEELDQEISVYSRKWSKSRISKVALAILRLALYEMKYAQDVPTSVSINEAVELAKKYGGEEDSQFVNGILGAVARGEHPEESETDG